jgi:hypothetical protein
MRFTKQSFGHGARRLVVRLLDQPRAVTVHYAGFTDPDLAKLGQFSLRIFDDDDTKGDPEKAATLLVEYFSRDDLLKLREEIDMALAIEEKKTEGKAQEKKTEEKAQEKVDEEKNILKFPLA